MTPSPCKRCGEPVLVTAAEMEEFAAGMPKGGKVKHWKRWQAEQAKRLPDFDLCTYCRRKSEREQRVARPRPLTKNQLKAQRRKTRGKS